MKEGRLVVPRTARYHFIGSEDGADELWIALHGYGQLARRFLRRFEGIDEGTRLVVAPEALSRFYLDPPRERVGRPDAAIGATWMTREDRENEIADYVSYLDALYLELAKRFDTRPRVVVLGFSQGVATACRWVAGGNVRPDRLILWSGALPPELFPVPDGSKLREPRMTVVVGEGDEYATPKVVENQRRLLADSEMQFELITHPGGHEIDGEVLRRISGP